MKRMGLLPAIGLLAFVLFLAACDGQLPGQLQSTLAPTAEQATVPPVVATAVATPTVVVATATTTATPEPTITPGPSPTPDPLALLVATVVPRLHAILPAPDESKRAEVVVYDCAPVGEETRALEILRIVEPATGTEYQLASQALSCGGLGAFGLEPLAWGASGRFFWYTEAREGGPDGACRPWVRPVVRVDLADWSQTTLEQAVASPDGTQVAGWLNGELVVYALDGGERGRVAPAALPPQVGPPAWSPDGAAIAYIQYTSFCGETAGDSAVVLVDATTFASRVLLTQAAPEFDSVSWLDATRLALTGLMDSGQWEYDVVSGTLTP